MNNWKAELDSFVNKTWLVLEVEDSQCTRKLKKASFENKLVEESSINKKNIDSTLIYIYIIRYKSWSTFPI